MVEPRDRLEEDERDEEAWPPFCAPTVKGNTKATAINAIPIRVNIIKLPARNSVRRHYGLFKRATQGKGGDWGLYHVTWARRASFPVTGACTWGIAPVP